MNLCQFIFKLFAAPVKAMRAAQEQMEARRLLGLRCGHSEYDLHNAYRELVKKHHPGLGGNRKDMDTINRAFDEINKTFR
jgi:hypothetical protein